MPDISQPLPSERVRRKFLEEAEASTGIVWSDDIEIAASRKIYFSYTQSTNYANSVEGLVYAIRREHSGFGDEPDGIQETLATEIDGERVVSIDRLDCISAIAYALRQLKAEVEAGEFQWGWDAAEPPRFDADYFEERANSVLLAHRVNWVFLNGALMPRGNQELFVEVIKPASELLGSNPKWLRVQKAYEKALTELARDDAGDAITDAATALQEMFRARGVEGSSVGAQAKKAVSAGIIAGHDTRLTDSILSLCNFVEAERSNNGDAHHESSEANKDDAWLAIHVVGALILRLSGEDFRNKKFTPAPVSESNSAPGHDSLAGWNGEDTPF